MDLNDIFTKPTGIKRPDHPDFWKLSEIILALKADTQDAAAGRITAQESERRWRANYEAVGDFDSIAYCAVQAGLQIHSIETGADWLAVLAMPQRHGAFVQSVQAYFDGFIMGAKLERSRQEGEV